MIRKRVLALFLSLIILHQGCCTVPYRGKNPANPNFERGQSIPPIDWLGNLVALPYKLLFWSLRLQNHCISRRTEEELDAFLEFHRLDRVKVRVAQFSFFGEMGRLFTNSDVGWAYRIFPGFVSTLVSSLTDWLLGGDYYNPFTNTIHLFSDDAAIALHEGGHALDFSRRKYRGTYAMMRMLVGADTYQEKIATEEAITYLRDQRKIQEEIHAYKILYPAYGSYVGGALSIFVPLPYVASIAGILVGHIWGRTAASKREKDWERIQRLEQDYLFRHGVASVGPTGKVKAEV